jgi:hypothetical protein
VTVDLGWNGFGPGRRLEQWKWSMCKEKGAPLQTGVGAADGVPLGTVVGAVAVACGSAAVE